MAMKRMRSEDVGNKDGLDDMMAKCLMMLSHGVGLADTKPITCPPPVHVFECKTCNRQFSSFQALGGHRASHKKPRLMGEEHKDQTKLQSSAGHNKPKMHECSICGQTFSMGQALGGHMKRHRANDGLFSILNLVDHAKVSVLMKRSNSTRVVCSLDLNLTPLENDLKLLFGKMAPKVDLRLMI
ncbi:zinc finger protein ZAT11-like [Carya illinoinensis]|nr:zinc finger protein ZAT11-like [Carya illinoinensis]